MSSRKSNYNKISMLKSKVVKRALRFDRKIVIENMVNSSSSLISSNPVANLAIPEIAKDFDEVEEVKEVTPSPQQQHEVEPEESEKNLFDDLDLDF